MNTKKILLWGLAIVIAFAIGGYLIDKNGGDWFEKRELKQDDKVIKDNHLFVDSVLQVNKIIAKKNDSLKQAIANNINKANATEYRMQQMRKDFGSLIDSLKKYKWQTATLADSMKSAVDARLLDSCAVENTTLKNVIGQQTTEIKRMDVMNENLVAVHQKDVQNELALNDKLALKTHDLKTEKRQKFGTKLLVVGEAAIIGILSFHILTK